jgi:hypothetical protein
MISIKRHEILNFFDKKDRKHSKHSSAINSFAGEELGVSLFGHFLQSKGFKVRREDHGFKNAQKTKKRLDAWITAISDSEKIIYQAEVKNWTSHSLGGRAIGASENLNDYCQDRWNWIWDKKQSSFCEKLRKALIKFDVPDEFRNFEHKALICIWSPVHPNGKNEFYFPVSIGGTNDEFIFNEAFVFSISLYLQNLKVESIELDMPATEERLEIFNKLFVRHL